MATCGSTSEQKKDVIAKCAKLCENLASLIGVGTLLEIPGLQGGPKVKRVAMIPLSQLGLSVDEDLRDTKGQ